MAIFLTELADWLRNAGLNVREYSGWQTRARGSGGYSDYPLCVMWHHTASPASWDGQKDADYIAEGDEDAPLANLYIDRSGCVWVLAAGATNTNGKGHAITFSRGTVSENCMNSHAVGIEMGNDGVGEQWPQAQVDAAFRTSNTVNARLGNQPDDISTHQFYAPDRKIDPATCNVAGPWKPTSCNSSGSWDRGSVQAECRNRVGNQPSEDDDMAVFDGFWKRDNADHVFAVYRDGTKKWIPDPGMLQAAQALEAINGAPANKTQVQTQSDPCMFSAFGVVVGPRPPGADEWGNIP